MIGYLKPDVNELRVRELKLYNAYYCGICTGLSKKYGPVSRLLLSYDSTFFVILSDALSGSQCQFAHARCPLPPFQKKRIVKSEDMRFGMEISKFFSDLKIDDFKRDSKGFMHLLSFFLFHFKSNDEFFRISKPYTDRILFSEISEESDPQEVADLFGKLSETMATSLSNLKRASNMIYLIGRWVYLIDALDDLEEDFKKKNYNPFLVKYGSNFDDPDFFVKIREKEKAPIDFLVQRIRQEYENLKIDPSINRNLVENVIFYGLPGTSTKILDKRTMKN
jgi:hypothetical protein